ncbi:MAG TPA: hypothetical protein VJX92_17205 [Methylomirabilota bacterium]|nr:hypothetical protein [Methylomirabilota bacterium]
MTSRLPALLSFAILPPSLRAQGRPAEAGAVDERFRRAWARADVALTSSRF